MLPGADDKLLSELSAYADGELDAAGAQALEARLNDPALQRQIALYKKLDQAVAALPVPEIPAAKAAAAWQQIAPYTVQLSAGERAVFARLDAATRELPVPQLSAAAFEQLWPRIAVRTVSSEKGHAAAPAPAVSQERWDKTWAEIEKKIESHPKMRSVSERQTAQPAALTVDFRAQSRRRWGWVAASVAAMVTLALLIGNAMQPEETEVAMEMPSVLDERYQLQVEYVAGQEQPVITFLRTPDQHESGWHWLPD